MQAMLCFQRVQPKLDFQRKQAKPHQETSIIYYFLLLSFTFFIFFYFLKQVAYLKKKLN